MTGARALTGPLLPVTQGPWARLGLGTAREELSDLGGKLWSQAPDPCSLDHSLTTLASRPPSSPQTLSLEGAHVRRHLPGSVQTRLPARQAGSPPRVWNTLPCPARVLCTSQPWLHSGTRADWGGGDLRGPGPRCRALDKSQGPPHRGQPLRQTDTWSPAEGQEQQRQDPVTWSVAVPGGGHRPRSQRSSRGHRDKTCVQHG